MLLAILSDFPHNDALFGLVSSMKLITQADENLDGWETIWLPFEFRRTFAVSFRDGNQQTNDTEQTNTKR